MLSSGILFIASTLGIIISLRAPEEHQALADQVIKGSLFGLFLSFVIALLFWLYRRFV